MNSTMITATNTLSQLQKQMHIISNNLANVDTNGYKSKNATFTDLLFNQINNYPAGTASREQNRLTPDGIRQGVGAKLCQVQIDMKQGSLKSTGRELDTAFQKEGQYYKVLVQKDNASSVQYTRDGALYLTPVSKNEVMLVTSGGYPVLDENDHPITIMGDASKYTINENGTMDVAMTDGTNNSYNLGVIQVNNPQFFEQKGGNLIGLPDNVPVGSTNNVYTNLTGQQRNQISIGQRMLEQSNVDMAKEMTDLISVQRAYQFQARSVTMSDQMMGLINGIR